MAVTLVPPFYDHRGFLDAAAAIARAALVGFEADRLMFSFHGLPERHIRRSDRSASGHCLTIDDCCASIGDANRDCYRAQCYSTARDLADRLRRPWGALLPSMPVPGGGVQLDEVAEVVSFYGRDSMLLVGGSLQLEADAVFERSRAFVAAVKQATRD